MGIVGLHGLINLVRFHGPVLGDGKRAVGDAPEGRRAACLVVKRVEPVADEHFVAPTAVGKNGREIALRSRGEEDRNLLADHVGEALLDPPDGWIAPKNIVADFGIGHGPAHARVGLGNGVASEVDLPVAR